MDDHRYADALTDDALDRDIAQALAVDPSPEFVARVRTRIAEEPAPSAWSMSWRTVCFVGGPAIAAAAIVAAVMLGRLERSTGTMVSATLAARPIDGAVSVPYVGSAFRRTYNAQTVHSSLRAVGPAKAGSHVLPDTIRGAVANPTPLLDPRETRALRSLIADLRDSRVDLTPLLRPGAPAPMELPPVDDLVIAPLAIEPLAPIDGAQGERP